MHKHKYANNYHQTDIPYTHKQLFRILLLLIVDQMLLKNLLKIYFKKSINVPMNKLKEIRLI